MEPYEAEYRMYNKRQTEVGHKLKTLKGTEIKRSRYGIGKLVGPKIYIHKNYVNRILPSELCEYIENVECPISYNIVRWMPGKQIALIECPDFDTAREPLVGRIYSIDNPGTEEEQVSLSAPYESIYHHKWMLVDNDYKGFDVAEAWNWSKKWLCVLREKAHSNSRENWNEQLRKIHLI